MEIFFDAQKKGRFARRKNLRAEARIRADARIRANPRVRANLRAEIFSGSKKDGRFARTRISAARIRADANHGAWAVLPGVGEGIWQPMAHEKLC